MNIAFFDLDGTLINGDSHRIVAQHIVDAPVINGDSRLRRLLGIFLYNSYVANAYRHVDGETYRRIAETVQADTHGLVTQHLRPSAISAVSEWRKRGFALCLITAADKCVADAVSRYLSFDFSISNAYLDASIKARAESAVFGFGKYVYARRLCERHDTSLAKCVFYSDSYDDLPLLLAVKEGWVVNPSVLMGALARVCGLRIAYWR